MATPAEVTSNSSWKGLLGCLVMGLCILTLLGWGVYYFMSVRQDQEQRIKAEFVDPYMAALLAGDPKTAWENLTTEAYRNKYPFDNYQTNFRKVLELFGKPTSVRVHSITKTHEPGRAAYYRVSTEWKWEKLHPITRSFELMDVPAAGYRLDDAHVRTNLQDVPPDPW